MIAARRPLELAGPWAVNLFVYGTLRRSPAHPMHVLLRETATPLGDARVRGVLHRVADHPGLVLDAAWVYEYAWSTAGLPIIATGDFLRQEQDGWA